MKPTSQRWTSATQKPLVSSKCFLAHRSCSFGRERLREIGADRSHRKTEEKTSYIYSSLRREDSDSFPLFLPLQNSLKFFKTYRQYSFFFLVKVPLAKSRS